MEFAEDLLHSKADEKIKNFWRFFVDKIKQEEWK